MSISRIRITDPASLSFGYEASTLLVLEIVVSLRKLWRLDWDMPCDESITFLIVVVPVSFMGKEVGDTAG